jgi:hypothetical protein
MGEHPPNCEEVIGKVGGSAVDRSIEAAGEGHGGHAACGGLVLGPGFLTKPPRVLAEVSGTFRTGDRIFMEESAAAPRLIR